MSRALLSAGALGLTSTIEDGAHFQTGRPVDFRFVRNTAKSVYLGAQFQQDIEPAGRFMLHDEHVRPLPGWEEGRLHFESPLVLFFSTDPGSVAYDAHNWKARLSRVYKAKGLALSKKILADGYDGIVTVREDGSTAEIVDLRPALVWTKRKAPRRNVVTPWR